VLGQYSCRGPDAVAWQVLEDVVVEDALHLLNGLERGAAALDAEMFIEKSAMPALDNAVTA
jgi:hypothetical protein